MFASSGVAVLSSDLAVRDGTKEASEKDGQSCVAARDLEELLALLSTLPRVIVLDRELGGGAAALHRLAEWPRRDLATVVLVARDPGAELPAGADVMASVPALKDAIAAAIRGVREQRPISITDLLGVSVLSGQLDDALKLAADQVAVGFHAQRCVISLRGDSTGAAAAGDQTWDSLAWSRTAENCRIAATSGATLVTSTTAGAPCESYRAVPLETSLGNHGFLALVASGARIFPRSHGEVLRALASRLASELSWRAVHRRTSDELDRLANGPGLDRMLGVWNPIAMAELAAMQISAGRRSNLPLSVMVVDVQDLQGINTRYGLDVGDQLLRRIADTLRALVRAEDVVGRWSGSEIAVLLHGTTIEGGQRVGERLRAALAVRPLELRGGGVLDIPVKVGIAGMQPNEEASALVARALWAAKRAPDRGTTVARASVQPTPRLSQQLEVGDELRATLGGTYRLLHEISRGGMGVVYRAEDLALERPVAIKMLRPDLAEDRALVESLRREAAMLARLQHPNLVQIYNFGQTGGDSYFVMELVEGEALQQAIDRHKLETTQFPVAEVCAMVDQISSALDTLHERGIVHRDVKPANVIRDPFHGRSILVDVGIARRYGQFVESAGTPGYASPEVIAGGEATPRSDVYGLAATAYAVLTLRSPWGDGEGVLGRQLSGDGISPPSAFRPELAPADEVLLGALAKEPGERPAAAGELARTLRAALSVVTTQAATDAPRWVGGTTVLPTRSARRTRGIVFRSVARALGMREHERLRDSISNELPELVRALTDTAPLEWLPTDLLARLLAVAPERVGRDSAQLARDIARATVRASFRRFFPASAATLVPERTLSAIRNVWSRYHNWGSLTSMPVSPTETVVRVTNTPRDANLCAWTGGMLEQLVILSGARTSAADHESCEARGDDACLFRVTWERSDAA